MTQGQPPQQPNGPSMSSFLSEEKQRELNLRITRERLQIHEYDCRWVRNEGSGMCSCGVTGGDPA